MGEMFTAQCSSCGFECNVTVGGGMYTHRTRSMFPALCGACKGIVSANVVPKPPVCDTCNGTDLVLYGAATRDPADADGAGFKGELEGRHLCPACKTYHFEFLTLIGVMFD